MGESSKVLVLYKENITPEFHYILILKIECASPDTLNSPPLMYIALQFVRNALRKQNAYANIL